MVVVAAVLWCTCIVTRQAKHAKCIPLNQLCTTSKGNHGYEDSGLYNPGIHLIRVWQTCLTSTPHGCTCYTPIFQHSRAPHTLELDHRCSDVTGVVTSWKSRACASQCLVHASLRRSHGTEKYAAAPRRVGSKDRVSKQARPEQSRVAVRWCWHLLDAAFDHIKRRAYDVCHGLQATCKAMLQDK